MASKIKKHVDVVKSIEEFEENFANGLYITPYVVYIGNEENGYDVVYSNDQNNVTNYEPDFIEGLSTRISRLENEKVYCYEEEYDNLILNGTAWLTGLDGIPVEHTYDSNKMYCIYEDDGPKPEEQLEEI